MCFSIFHVIEFAMWTNLNYRRISSTEAKYWLHLMFEKLRQMLLCRRCYGLMNDWMLLISLLLKLYSIFLGRQGNLFGWWHTWCEIVKDDIYVYVITFLLCFYLFISKMAKCMRNWFTLGYILPRGQWTIASKYDLMLPFATGLWIC